MLQYPSPVHHYIKTCLVSTEYKRNLILFCFFRVRTDRRMFGQVLHRFSYKFGNVHSTSFIKSSRKPQNVRKMYSTHNMSASLSATSVRNIFHSGKHYASCNCDDCRHIRVQCSLFCPISAKLKRLCKYLRSAVLELLYA